MCIIHTYIHIYIFMGYHGIHMCIYNYMYIYMRDIYVYGIYNMHAPICIYIIYTYTYIYIYTYMSPTFIVRYNSDMDPSRMLGVS